LEFVAQNVEESFNLHTQALLWYDASLNPSETQQCRVLVENEIEGNPNHWELGLSFLE
jgi:hypothetical protein